VVNKRNLPVKPGPSLLEEMEAVFCYHCKSSEERRGCAFFPVVSWSAVLPDE